jgi:hypothetical protein
MYDWNAPASPNEPGHSDGGDEGDRLFEDGAVDRELEAAIEYKLAVSGFAGIADIVELVDRAVRRRWSD